jgi:predicted RNase H-like nuclease
MTAPVAGVDGCPGGWICVQRTAADTTPLLSMFATFSDLAARLPEQAMIAVDIPIGLPDRIRGTGRAAEQAVRPLLAGKSSSVFSVPSRRAIEEGMKSWKEYKAGRLSYTNAYERAKQAACETSEPPKSLSRQTFGILPKIAEVDRLLCASHGLSKRVFESHPEFAFAILNNGNPMAHPKKAAIGMAERRAFLISKGFTADFLNQPVPRGANTDDFLDACVMMLIAERHARGEAIPYPSPYIYDSFGLPIAIHA